MENFNEQFENEENLQEKNLGKFKDEQSLLDAYNALQAEFTRKCQKLAELNKMQNNCTKSENMPQNNEKNENILKNVEDAGCDLGQNEVPSQCEIMVESENKSSPEASNFSKQVAEFFTLHADAKDLAKSVGQILLDNPKMCEMENAVELAYKLAKSEQLKTPAELAEDEDFLSTYVFSKENIQSRVMEQILEKAKASAPKIINSKVGGSAVYVQSAPKNLEDAKTLILKRIQEI